jgi:hypothetical protein
MLGAMSEGGLVVRLHKLGLLPEANRNSCAESPSDLRLQSIDAVSWRKGALGGRSSASPA